MGPERDSNPRHANTLEMKHGPLTAWALHCTFIQETDAYWYNAFGRNSARNKNFFVKQGVWGVWVGCVGYGGGGLGLFCSVEEWVGGGEGV